MLPEEGLRIQWLKPCNNNNRVVDISQTVNNIKTETVSKMRNGIFSL